MKLKNIWPFKNRKKKQVEVQKAVDSMIGSLEYIARAIMAHEFNELGVPEIVKLPDDSDLVHKLGNKLVEYRLRMSKNSNNNDNRFKLRVLSELFKSNELDVIDLYEKIIRETSGNLDSDAYINACAVVHDYCTTQGNNCLDGTGL